MTTLALRLRGRFGRPIGVTWPVLVGSALAVGLALVLPGAITDDPRLALAFPAAAVGGVVTQRFPTASLAVVFAMNGIYGSVIAFTPLPAESIADATLEGLWVGVLGSYVLGLRRTAIRPTPVLFMLAGFLAMSVVAALTTTPLSNGIRAVRIGPQFLSVLLLLGYGGFRTRTLDRLAGIMVVVSAVVAAYAALRWAIGTSAKERALTSTARAIQYNQLAITGDAKVQGSLPNGNLLGLWLACTLPFLVAVVISWRGALRVVAAAGIPLGAIALLGSAQRAATAAVIAGALTVIAIHMLSRGFRGPRLGVVTATALVLIVSAAVVYPVVVDNPEKQQRYENLLTPSQDVAFQERLHKWRATLAELRDQPFGFGMGAGNPGAVQHRFADIGQRFIDNSYLMIAYDQGIVVAAFFVVTMLVLLLELLRYAVWTRGPGPAALATAAAGTLVAILVEFMSGNYVTDRPLVGGWMVVGLGIAQFAVVQRSDNAVAHASARP